MGGFDSAQTGETNDPPPDDISGTIPNRARKEAIGITP